MLLKISQEKVVKTILDRLRVTRIKVAGFKHKEQPGSFLQAQNLNQRLNYCILQGTCAY